MPFSNKSGKKEVKEFLVKNMSPDTRVLDVGPGSGIYSELLRENFQNMDACEIHAPYIKRYKLSEKYNNVHNMSVVDFKDFDNYDLVILGDILEHLTVDDAKAVLTRCSNVKQVLIAVPYESPQGAFWGVEAEIHQQDDLTPEIFLERYPDFEPFFFSKRKRKKERHTTDVSYGYYFRKGSIPAGESHAS